MTTENGDGGKNNNLLSCFDDGICLETSWVFINLLEDGGIRCVYFVTDKIGWVAGTNNIYKTIDGGRHWALELFT